MCLAKRLAYNIKKKECFINVDETFLLYIFSYFLFLFIALYFQAANP